MAIVTLVSRQTKKRVAARLSFWFGDTLRRLYLFGFKDQGGQCPPQDILNN
jgi:hypothetical protein